MKIVMTNYRNEECDHFVLLTEHCRTCHAIYHKPLTSFIRRWSAAISLAIQAIRSAI